MTAAPAYPDLHELVDQLSPAQADALRAVVIQFVTPTPVRAHALPRHLSFVGTLSAEPDLAERSKAIVDEIAARNAG